MELETILQRIITTTGMKNDDLERKITDKQRELSGLVSREGAAYIIAKEFGLDLFEKPKRRLEIKSLVPGLKNVSLTARIVRIFEPKQFERAGKKSAVANVILGDASGNVRLSLWDQQIEILKQMQTGLAVEIMSAYTKDDGRGGIEIRLSKRGGFKIIPQSDLPSVDKLKSIPQEKIQRSDLSSLKEGGSFEVRAAIVQLFDSNPFYEVCPTCSSRIKKETVTEGVRQYMVYKCAQHGEVQPTHALVLSGVIDDGTANIRAVWFREAATNLIGMPIDMATQHKDNLLESIDVLGKEFLMTGRVKRNKVFNRLEFIVNDVKPVEMKQETEALINKLNKSS